MIFNQFEFLFLFLPAVLFFGLLPALRRARLLIVLAFSLFFYGLSGLEHLTVLCAAIVWVYLLMRSNASVGNPWRLSLAVIGPALALIYYKYSHFILTSIVGRDVVASDPTFSLFQNILLPAGISFFTFQLVSFAIDRYRGEIDQPPRFVEFALFISFFPHLVAGPIVRYRQIAESLRGLPVWRLSSNDALIAIGYVVCGLASKVLIADTLAHHQAPLIHAVGTLTVPASYYVLFGYSFQIYFDFYGYSLMAIGLARFFGFFFPPNFNRPYESLNPREFWRRWHMSLSFWIRDYLYVPLGGNGHYVRNIMIVFAVVGLWHGAAWTFVIWGIYHGVLVIAYAMTKRWWDLLPRLLQIFLTFMLVSLGWAFFIFDFESIGLFYANLLGYRVGAVGAASMEMWAVLLVAAAVCFGVNCERIIARGNPRPYQKLLYGGGLAAALLLSILLIDGSMSFIYFRF